MQLIGSQAMPGPQLLFPRLTCCAHVASALLAGVAWIPAGFLAVVFGLLAALIFLPRPWNWAVVALNLATVLVPLRLPAPRWATRFLRFSVAESRRCEWQGWGLGFSVRYAGQGSACRTWWVRVCTVASPVLCCSCTCPAVDQSACSWHWEAVARWMRGAPVLQAAVLL